MSRLLFFCAVLAMAQDVRTLTSVHGTVISDESLSGNRLVADLVESGGHTEISRVDVASDGSFEFHNVPVGMYTIEVRALGADPIQQQSINLQSSSDQIEVRLPTQVSKPLGTGLVSVRQLQHPLSSKAKKIFQTAQKISLTGDYSKEIEILRTALNDPSAVPYARMNIGVAYIRSGQPAAGIPDLMEASKLMPDSAVAHSNLAYALLMIKRLEPAEAECRRALELDRNNPKTRWVMGSILLNKGAHEDEAVEDLRFASREIPKAKMILAQFYERHGKKEAAVRELREYLPQASDQERSSVERWITNLTKQ